MKKPFIKLLCALLALALVLVPLISASALSLPGLPPLPDLPDLPGLPDLPDLPDIPDLPEPPDVPGFDGIPGLDDLPGFDFTTPAPDIDIPSLPRPSLVIPGFDLVTPTPNLDIPSLPRPSFVIPGFDLVTPTPGIDLPNIPRPSFRIPNFPRPTADPTVNPGDSVKKYTGKEFTSFGPYFREMRPKLTDEWYMFTPIELSFEGEQVYPLIASNEYIIGEVKLLIQGGMLTVDYEVLEGVKVRREFMTFFSNLDSVQTVNVNMLGKQNIPFRTPLDIARTFGADPLVILYINNSVEFATSVPGLTHFVPEQYRPWMQDMLQYLD